jgi:hypothetical protein
MLRADCLSSTMLNESSVIPSMLMLERPAAYLWFIRRNTRCGVHDTTV